MGSGVDEDKTMHTPPVYWGRINGWSILASIGSSVVVGFGLVIGGSLFYSDVADMIENGVTKYELNEALAPIKNQIAEGERFRTVSSASTDKNFDEMRTLVAPVAGTVFRVSQLETTAVELRTQISEAEKRTDRILLSINNKMDKVVDGGVDTATGLKVLGSQVEALKERLEQQERTPQKLLWRSGVTHPDRPVPAPPVKPKP